MDPATIAQLIILLGFPLADRIITKWANKEPITPEEWAEIRKGALQTAKDRATLKLTEMGIPLDSERAKDLLELVG